jgi:hypothetical protein
MDQSREDQPEARRMFAQVFIKSRRAGSSLPPGGTFMMNPDTR